MLSIENTFYWSGSFSCFRFALRREKLSYVLSTADMKHFLQKLFSQLMDCCVDVESKEEEKDIQKKTHCSMDSLSSWYMNVTQVNVHWQFSPGNWHMIEEAWDYIKHSTILF